MNSEGKAVVKLFIISSDSNLLLTCQDLQFKSYTYIHIITFSLAQFKLRGGLQYHVLITYI